MSPIGWGILGIGRHPERKMVPAIGKAADCRLVAVCSWDKARAQAFARCIPRVENQRLLAWTA